MLGHFHHMNMVCIIVKHCIYVVSMMSVSTYDVCVFCGWLSYGVILLNPRHSHVIADFFFYYLLRSSICKVRKCANLFDTFCLEIESRVYQSSGCELHFSTEYIIKPYVVELFQSFTNIYKQ